MFTEIRQKISRYFQERYVKSRLKLKQDALDKIQEARRPGTPISASQIAIDATLKAIAKGVKFNPEDPILKWFITPPGQMAVQAYLASKGEKLSAAVDLASAGLPVAGFAKSVAIVLGLDIFGKQAATNRLYALVMDVWHHQGESKGGNGPKNLQMLKGKVFALQPSKKNPVLPNHPAKHIPPWVQRLRIWSAVRNNQEEGRKRA